MNVITLASRKGGAGKSTLTAQLAAQAHALGKRVLVIEHQAEQKCCPVCQQVSAAPFPEEVRAPVQYGAAFGAVGVYLVQQQLLPYERACEVMQDLLGPTMSVGTLQALVQRCAERLEPVEHQLKAALSHIDLAKLEAMKDVGVQK